MISRILAGVVFLVGVVASVADAAILHGPVINPVNGRAYYLLESDTWQGSAAQANALGGHLVVINDQAENEWVVATFGNHGGVPRNLWLGLSDAAKEGTFEWMTREPLSFTNWKAGEPDNSQAGENYAFIHAPTEVGQPGAGAWGDTLNAGDGGQIAFHGVVETEHLQNDNLFTWSTGRVGFYGLNPWAIAWSSAADKSGGLYNGPSYNGGSSSYNFESGLYVWRANTSGVPTARLNSNAVPAGATPLQPYEIIFEPGANGETVEALWEAPIAGSYIVKAAFTDIDTAGDGQDVQVFIDGGEVFSTTINAAAGNARVHYVSPAPVKITQGQQVRISVGKGSGSSDAVGDGTRIEVSVCYADTALTQYSGSSSGIQLDSVGNLALTVGSDKLTYDPAGNILSKEAVIPESLDRDYVQVADGKVSKLRGTDGQLLWVRALDPTFTNKGIERTLLDAQGDVLLVGEYESPNSPSGGVSYFRCVEKYAAEDGQLLWRKSLGSLFKGSVEDLETDSKGDIVVVGFSDYTMMRVWKISATDGQFLWQNHFYNAFAVQPILRGNGISFMQCIFDNSDNPVVVGKIIGKSLASCIYTVKHHATSGVKQWEKLWRRLGDANVRGALAACRNTLDPADLIDQTGSDVPQAS